MKKLVFLAILATAGLSVNNVQAQQLDVLKTVQTINKVNNAAKTAKTLANTLKTTLGLSKTQEVSVISTLTKYIKSTNAISKLANSNATQYAAQLAGINTNTLNTLKTILTATQYSKMLGLGKSSNGLASLFGNTTNSSNAAAMNVLGGLLSTMN